MNDHDPGQYHENVAEVLRTIGAAGLTVTGVDVPSEWWEEGQYLYVAIHVPAFEPIEIDGDGA